MRLLSVFLILMIILVFVVIYSVQVQDPILPIYFDPLLPIYQELKIGMGREEVYAIVGNYYPGQMAKINYEMNEYEIWSWSWPPEKENSLEMAFLGIEFFNDKVSYAYYKHVSPKLSRIIIKRLYKPK